MQYFINKLLSVFMTCRLKKLHILSSLVLWIILKFEENFLRDSTFLLTFSTLRNQTWDTPIASSRERVLHRLLSLSIYSFFSFTWGQPLVAYVSFLFFPSVLSFIEERVLEGVLYFSCHQYSYSILASVVYSQLSKSDYCTSFHDWKNFHRCLFKLLILRLRRFSF